MNRRYFLACGALTLCSPAWAFGEKSHVDIAELDLGPGTTRRPNAWKRLLYEVTHTTSIECEPNTVLVKPTDQALFEHPFTVVQVDGAFEPVSDAALEQLTRYVSYGGFLLIDDTTGQESGPSSKSIERFVRRLYPNIPLSSLPASHSIFRAFFLLKHAVGRVSTTRWLEGITVGDLTPVVVMRNDLSGALDRLDNGSNRFPVVPGGESQRREAKKLGINLVMYTMTANYKRDQAHVRRLMLEGRIE